MSQSEVTIMWFNNGNNCSCLWLIIIASSVYHVVALGANSASDMKNYQLEVACIILCYICYVMSIQHLNESDGAMTDSIKADLHRVITTVEKVKSASNSIMDGVTVVRELASENKHGSEIGERVSAGICM